MKILAILVATCSGALAHVGVHKKHVVHSRSAVHLLNAAGGLKHRASHRASHRRAAPAAPSPAPSPSSGDAVEMRFEIYNYDYHDLTEPVMCEEGTRTPATLSGKAKDMLEGADKEVMEQVSKNRDGVEKAVQSASGMDDIVNQIADHVAGATGAVVDAAADAHAATGDAINTVADSASAAVGGASLLQQHAAVSKLVECGTVMDHLRERITAALKKVVLEVLGTGAAPSAAPSSSPAPAAAFLGMRQPNGASLQADLIPPAAPATPAALVNTTAEDDLPVKIFVTFYPGSEKAVGDKTLTSTIVSVSLSGEQAALNELNLGGLETHELVKLRVGSGLYKGTGHYPAMGNITVQGQKVVKWSVAKCEGHMQKIVGQFSLAYTRRMVPMAMYNECTNFLTRMSFSHDHVLDPLDSKRCRKATMHLAEHWQFGSGGKAKEIDVSANATAKEVTSFADVCYHACELKYGEGAPQCEP